MKFAKPLALAVVAAAALMAFLGSSTASATVLCNVEGLPNGGPTGTTCPEQHGYGKGTTIHAVNVGTIKMTTTFKNIECTESTLSWVLENEGGPSETVTATDEEVVYANCNCEVKVLAKGTLEIHWIEDSHNGTLTAKETEWTVQCNTILGAVHCIYSTDGGIHIGTLTGGADPIIHMEENNIPRLETSSACAEKAHWDATYTVTSPKPLWVTGHT
jgi:hypothetical protein